MSKSELIFVLQNAINAYEFELEQQDYDSAEELHDVVLNELMINEDAYLEIMGEPYTW